MSLGKHEAFAVCLGITGTFLFVFGATQMVSEYSADDTSLDFVCEDDARITEHHIGVRSARMLPKAGGVWVIRYTDGAKRYYVQPSGETCGTEPSLNIEESK